MALVTFVPMLSISNLKVWILTEWLSNSGGATARVYEAQDQKPGTRDHHRVALKVHTSLGREPLSSACTCCILHQHD